MNAKLLPDTPEWEPGGRACIARSPNREQQPFVKMGNFRAVHVAKKQKNQAKKISGVFSNDPETLAEQIFLDRRHWGEDAARPIVERAAAMHNDGMIDLFRVVDTKLFQKLEAFEFFGGQHFFCEVIPFLNGSSQQVMSLVKSLVEKAGEDLAANQPNAALVQWCRKDVQRAHSIVNAAENGDGLASVHATFALVAAEDRETALRWLVEFEDERQLSAITALGRMSYDHPDQASGVLSSFSKLAEKDHRDPVLSNLLASAIAICKTVDQFTFPSLKHIVESCSQFGGDHTRYQSARALWQFGKSLSAGQVDLLLENLKAIEPEHSGTLRELDHALATLFDVGYRNEVADFFAHLATSVPDAIDGEVFSSFLRGVLGADPTSIGDILTGWLLSGNRTLCDCVSKKLGDSGARPSEIDLSGYFATLDNHVAVFVCRKAVGFLFFAPEVVVSFLTAAVRVSETGVREAIAKLLFDPISINYGGAAPEALSLIPKDDLAFDTVQVVLARYESYRNSLAAIGNIKELHPTESQRQIEWQRSQEQMRKIQKLAFEKSVFFDLVSHSTLLYGRSSQILSDGPDGERTATEVALQEHSTSVEIPRLHIFDPIGIDYMLRVFRNEKLQP